MSSRSSRVLIGCSRYYITASAGDTHRVLKIDRTNAEELNVVEDATQYDDEQLELLLRMVEDGNRSQGGLNKVLDFYGVVGFVRFTSTWYIVIITGRSVVGLLGGHYSECRSWMLYADRRVYHCDKTKVREPCDASTRKTRDTVVSRLLAAANVRSCCPSRQKLPTAPRKQSTPILIASNQCEADCSQAPEHV